MTRPARRGVYSRRCARCGWQGTYDTAGKANFAKRQHSCDRWLAKSASAERRRQLMDAIDRTPKPCLHKKARHQHGTYACYVLDRCRCKSCFNASSEYDRGLARRNAYGRSHFVDATPAREHIQSLTNQGMGLKRIVAVSDISQGLLWKLVYGKTKADGSRTPSKRVRRDTEERILAIELDLADGAKVISHGTRRRLQALVALGYSQSHLAERLGIGPGNFGHMLHHRSEVLKSTADAVAALYDELSMTPRIPTDHRTKISVSRARNYAAEMGWLPPLAWDDDSLDDPFSESASIGEDVPHTRAEVDEIAVQRALAGDPPVRLTKADRAEIVRRWKAAGRPSAELERVTGINSSRYTRRSA